MNTSVTNDKYWLFERCGSLFTVVWDNDTHSSYKRFVTDSKTAFNDESVVTNSFENNVKIFSK